LRSLDEEVVQAFLAYIGAAVTSSIAGVLLRTVVRSLVLSGSRGKETPWSGFPPTDG